MDLPIIMNYLYDELIKKEEYQTILMTKKDLQILYDVLNFILEEFTKNIYPETMLTNIYEYLTEYYNYDIWSGKGGLDAK